MLNFCFVKNSVFWYFKNSKFQNKHFLIFPWNATKIFVLWKNILKISKYFYDTQYSNKFNLFGKQELDIPKLLKKFEAHFSLRIPKHDFAWRIFSTIFLEARNRLREKISTKTLEAQNYLKHENAWGPWSTKSLEGKIMAILCQLLLSIFILIIYRCNI